MREFTVFPKRFSDCDYGKIRVTLPSVEALSLALLEIWISRFLAVNAALIVVRSSAAGVDRWVMGSFFFMAKTTRSGYLPSQVLLSNGCPCLWLFSTALIRRIFLEYPGSLSQSQVFRGYKHQVVLRKLLY